MLARLGAANGFRGILVLVATFVLATAAAQAQPGGRRGPGPGAGAGPGAGPGRGPGGPSHGGPGGAGGLDSPGPAAPGPAAPPRAAVPVAPTVPAAVAVPQQPLVAPATGPSSGRVAVGPAPFTAEWYAQHPDAWQHPKPYAEWRSAPVPPAAVVSAFFGTDGGANPSLTATTNVEWLSLGVFSSAARSGGQNTVFQQLAVSKSGQLKGVMVDTATGVVQSLSGLAEVSSGRVSWDVGPSGGLSYETSLDELLKQAPAVTLATPAGRQPGTLVFVPGK